MRGFTQNKFTHTQQSVDKTVPKVKGHTADTLHGALRRGV